MLPSKRSPGYSRSASAFSAPAGGSDDSSYCRVRYSRAVRATAPTALRVSKSHRAAAPLSWLRSGPIRSLGPAHRRSGFPARPIQIIDHDQGGPAVRAQSGPAVKAQPMPSRRLAARPPGRTSETRMWRAVLRRASGTCLPRASAHTSRTGTGAYPPAARGAFHRHRAGHIRVRDPSCCTASG